MTALHHCDANVKRRVSFHLCVPIREIWKFMSTIDDDRTTIKMSCNILLGNKNESSINFANKQVTYPINILRNMAMKNTYTEYVLPIDVDILPSMNVNGKFLNFINTHIEQKTAFILPVFETNVSINATVTRDTLIEMWDRGNVRPFHHNFCRHCHAHTDYQRWKSIQVGKNLSVGYYRDRKQYWEPYLISRRDEVPDYNETFKGYGFDRMSQMCELYMSGFQFAVLDDGFLIHDGFKERRSTYKDRAREIKEYRVFYTDSKRILLKRYSKTGRTLPLTRQ